MDQAIGTARETAAFARRVVLRALTVVGGAAAATALAWCLSSASASAETGTPPVPEIPAVDTIVSPVTGALDTVAPLQDPPPAGAVEGLGERVRKAAGRFGERAQDQQPACMDPLCWLAAGRSEAPDAGDGAGLGRSDSPSPAPVASAPATAGPVASPGTDPAQTAGHTATGRVFSDDLSRRGSPAPEMPSVPGVPAPPAPAPASGHTGSAGNPADSPLFAALPWQDRAPALVRGFTVPATEAVSFGRVGVQPGVNPD